MGVVAMLVTGEDCLYLARAYPQPLHSFFSLPAGNTSIYQHRLILITDVVAITVASRIKGGYEQGHCPKNMRVRAKDGLQRGIFPLVEEEVEDRVLL